MPGPEVDGGELSTLYRPLGDEKSLVTLGAEVR